MLDIVEWQLQDTSSTNCMLDVVYIAYTCTDRGRPIRYSLRMNKQGINKIRRFVVAEWLYIYIALDCNARERSRVRAVASATFLRSFISWIGTVSSNEGLENVLCDIAGIYYECDDNWHNTLPRYQDGPLYTKRLTTHTHNLAQHSIVAIQVYWPVECWSSRNTPTNCLYELHYGALSSYNYNYNCYK